MKLRALGFFVTVLVSALIGGILATWLTEVRAASQRPLKVDRFETLQAERFELVDSKGNRRGVLTTTGPGNRNTLFRLRGPERSSMMLLVGPSDEGGSTISFFDEKNMRVLNLQEHRPLFKTQRPKSRGTQPPDEKEEDVIDKGGDSDVWDEIARIKSQLAELNKRVR